MIETPNPDTIELNKFSVGIVYSITPKAIYSIASGLPIFWAYDCARLMFAHSHRVIPFFSHTVVFEPEADNKAKVILRYFGEGYPPTIRDNPRYIKVSIMPDVQHYELYVGRGKRISEGEYYDSFDNATDANEAALSMLKTLRTLKVRKAWVRVIPPSQGTIQSYTVYRDTTDSESDDDTTGETEE